MNFRAFSTLILCLLPTISCAAPLKVVASIKPLQLIAQEVVGDLGETEVLIPPGASPHHYALKPSDRRKLAAADLVIWVGPELELFLAKTLQGSRAPVLQLLDDTGHEAQDALERAAGDDGHEHHHHGRDPHIWLDPVQALQLAAQVKDRLTQLLPEQAARLEANYRAFGAALLQADRELRQQLAPLRDKGFYVFHDGYGHLVEHYGLKQLGYFTLDPGRQPGARHLAEIRAQLERQAAVCVFSEPQFKAAVVAAVTEGLAIGHGELDPLAQAVPLQPGAYLAYLRQLVSELTRCLAAH